MTFHLFPRAVPKSATGRADCAICQCFLSPRHPYLADFPSAAVQQDFQLGRNLPACCFLSLLILLITLLPQQIIHAHTIKISKIPQSSQLRHSFAMLYLGNRCRSIGAIISFIVLLCCLNSVWLKPLLSRNALNRVIIFLLLQFLQFIFCFRSRIACTYFWGIPLTYCHTSCDNSFCIHR